MWNKKSLLFSMEEVLYSEVFININDFFRLLSPYCSPLSTPDLSCYLDIMPDTGPAAHNTKQSSHYLHQGEIHLVITSNTSIWLDFKVIKHNLKTSDKLTKIV